MDLFQLKIEKDDSVVKYIKIIRKFDSSLSMGAIKQQIEENNFVIGFDLEYYDVLEDINGIDRKEEFYNMIKELSGAGAQVSVYQNGESVSIQFLANLLKSLAETRQQIECDIDRELGL